MRSSIALVVDDDEEMRALIAAILGANGLDVRQFPDGQAALAYLDAVVGDPCACPDVVLADVKMPNLSGLGLLSALRRAGVDVPVVLMTALADPSVATLGLRLGAVDVLRKPFGPEGLLRAIAKAHPLRAGSPADAEASLARTDPRTAHAKEDRHEPACGSAVRQNRPRGRPGFERGE